MFFVVLLGSAWIRETETRALDQAVVWVPSGAAIAGLWLLGWRYAWVVLLATLSQRLLIGYNLSVAAPAALGSAFEALLGVLVLRRLAVRGALERLADVGGVVAAAVLAPLASISVSWIARGHLWSDPTMPFYSGWDGWWRMNALGILVVVPTTLAWSAASGSTRTSRAAARALAGAVALPLVVVAIAASAPVAVSGIAVVNLVVLPPMLYVALRHGPRGAAPAGALTTIALSVYTAAGAGPFLAVPASDRPFALQTFELVLIGLPLVFAALIAERDAARAGGLRSDELRRALQQVLPDTTYRLHRDGTCLDVLVPEGMVAPKPAVDLSGRDLRAIVDADDPGLYDRTVGRVLAERAVVTIEYELHADGVRRQFEARCVPHGEDEVFALVRDVTARRMLDQQLRHSQKMEAVGKLAGGIAHDFNNLLTAIAGYAAVIRDEAPDGSSIREHAGEVLKGADRAARLTRQLLAYGRQQMLAPEVLDLSEIVDHLGGMLRRLIGEELRLEADAVTGAWVRVDRGQMEQVLVNLVVNARDALRPGGLIEVRTCHVDVDGDFAAAHLDLNPGAYVALSVRDDGSGMTPEVRERAFDPFFTTKERWRGTGLGLSTVYGIVRQSGGAIWIDSEPAIGTTVWIFLPAQAPPAEEAERGPVAGDTDDARGDDAPTSATVLVVEDEGIVRDLARMALSRAGMAVLEAADGIAALEVARAHAGTIDLLLTDVVMPRMGGRELARQLAAERPAMAVLYMSGYPNEARELGDLTGNDAGFLAKPFAAPELVLSVRRLIAAGLARRDGAIRPAR